MLSLEINPPQPHYEWDKKKKINSHVLICLKKKSIPQTVLPLIE